MKSGKLSRKSGPKLSAMRFWTLLSTLLLCLPAATLAQPVSPPDAAPAAQRPRTALVLSGGGARGFAHVGVLKALEEARVPVDLIVGTSMGAIIGGLYATGMGADDIERELLKVDWGGLFNTREPRQLLSQRRKEEDFDFSPVLQLGFKDGEFRLPTGAVSSRSLEMLLRRYTLGARHLPSFDQLPTPFRAVATDMETGEAVVLKDGDLAAALRASMSVPGVFSPLELGGRILGDGGLVNNLPVDVARAMGAQTIIAVNIGTPLAPRDTLGSLVGVTRQMINILTEQNVRRSVDSLTSADLLLTPDLGTLSSSDFDKAPELVARGHTYAGTVANSLARYSQSPGVYAFWEGQRNLAHEQGAPSQGEPLAFVRIEGVRDERTLRLQSRLEVAAGQPLDTAAVERDLQRLAASDDYSRVNYRLERDPQRASEGLVYELTEKDTGPHRFRVGLGLRTDFSGQGAFSLAISHNQHWFNESGAEWRNRIRLGERQGLYSEIYQPLDRRSDSFLATYVDHELRHIELFDLAGDPLAEFTRNSTRVGLDYGWTLGRDAQLGDARVGLTAARFGVRPDIVAAPLTATRFGWTELGLRASLVADQLDYANFPQSGYRFQTDFQVGQRRSQGQKDSFTRLQTTLTGVRSFGPHTFNAQVQFAHANNIPVGAIEEFSLGGFQQLSGYRVGQVVGNYLAFGRLSYYRRLPYNPGIARALFVGGSLELGNAWTNRKDMRWGDLRAGSSVFLGADTGFGPMYLALVHAPRGFTGVYFFLGRP